MSVQTIEEILGAARRAALAGGLTRLLRVHLHIGPEAGVSEREVRGLLAERWQGPLFDECEVTFERSDSGSLALAAVEGESVELA